jgi:hypothetical protein
MKGNSKRPKEVVMAVFWKSLGWTGIWSYARTRLILKKATTRDLMRVVMDVTNRITIWNGTGVQRSIVSTRTPTAVLLRHDMKYGGPRTLRAASCAIPQHGVEMGFGDSEQVRCESTSSVADW